MNVFLVLIAALAAAKPLPSPPDPEVARGIIDAAEKSAETWDELRVLCDEIGHRLTGTPALEKAVAWGAEEMRQDGLAVELQPVQVPVWLRGPASLRLEGPVPRDLPLLALGGSVGTPDEGISAEVLVVGSFEELDQRKAEAVGKIVVWDVPFTDYGTTVAYRGRGAIAAAQAGAVASLTRSVTPVSLQTPHTGMMRYDDAVPKVPAAAITVEDAQLLRRIAERGPAPRLTLHLSATRAPEATSHNVIGTIVGREKPKEVVVLGCHLDSWDVGQGAQDDGAGCVSVMEVGRLIAALPVKPRRTVEIVLFTNEESGLRGGPAYAGLAKAAKERHVAAIESDIGAGPILGFSLEGGPPEGDLAANSARVSAAIAELGPLAAVVGPLGATLWQEGGAGADVEGLVEAGALGIGVELDTTGYWPIHHTEADTLDKIDPAVLRRNTAAVAALAWWLAETPTPVAPAPKGKK